MGKFKPDPTDPVANEKALSRRQRQAREIERLTAEVERLKDDAIHNEGVMVALKVGYEERGVEVERLQGQQTMEKKALFDESCEWFKDKTIITDEQIDAAVEMAIKLYRSGCDCGWLTLDRLGIKRCSNPSWGEDHTLCPTCRKYTNHGWVKEEKDV